MAANTSPIFPLTPNIGFVSITSANTALDGTGSPDTIFTAGTNGARVDEIRLSHLGTNVATVCRIFINNGSTTATATNNSLWREIAMAANSLSQTAVSVQGTVVPTNGLVLPAGYKLTATIGTAVSAGIKVLALGGNY